VKRERLREACNRSVKGLESVRLAMWAALAAARQRPGQRQCRLGREAGQTRADRPCEPLSSIARRAFRQDGF